MPGVGERAARRTDVYVERGAKRTFASALEWPGWARSGRDERSALEALLASARRYGKVARRARLDFDPPESVASLRVIERLPGTTTTDFGAPDAVPKSDTAPLEPAELKRLEALIRAAWATFDAAVAGAKDRTLAPGPRGGGRSREKIAAHVRDAEGGYLSALGWKSAAGADDAARRDAVLDGLRASAAGEIPAKGPRGGTRWKPRQFARRLAWHAIDHAWEIEDRSGD